MASTATQPMSWLVPSKLLKLYVQFEMGSGKGKKWLEITTVVQDHLFQAFVAVLEALLQ